MWRQRLAALAVGLGVALLGEAAWADAAPDGGAADAEVPPVEPAPAPPPAVVVAPPPSPGPVIVVTMAPAPSSTWPAGLRLSGYLQADGQLYDRASEDELDPSTRAPLNQTRVLLRRARVRLDVDHARVGAALELDANTVNGASVGVVNAEARLQTGVRDESGAPWTDLSLGLVRTPWGYEVLQRDQQRFFLERSTMSRALFPGVYDLGLRVRGSWRFLELQVAAMNGQPLGDRSFAGLDPNRAKDLVGRVGVAATGRRVSFAAGVSGLAGKGFHAGTPETKDVLTWRDQNEDGLVQLSELQAISGAAATPSSNFGRFALGADARVTVVLPVVGALEVFGEATWASNLDRGLVPADPVARGRDLRERGLVVGLVQELGTRVAAGVRYDRYDPDADASEARALAVVPIDATFSTWTGTVAWRWTGFDRVALEVQRFTNALGRDASGAPATLGGTTLTLRGQVAW